MDKERLEEIKDLYLFGVEKGIFSLDHGEIEWLIDTAEEQETKIEMLGESEHYLVRIRDLLSGYKFPSGVTEFAIAEPSGIYDMVSEFRRMFEEQQKEIEMYRDYLTLIRNIGTFGTDVKTKEVVRSDEANLAHEALERV